MRPNLSRAARRDLRRVAVLADELNVHSYRIHADGSITWTRWHDLKPAKPESKDEGQDDSRASSEPSKRTLRSRRRATALASTPRRRLSCG